MPISNQFFDFEEQAPNTNIINDELIVIRSNEKEDYSENENFSHGSHGSHGSGHTSHVSHGHTSAAG
ncbi:MAG: hypothetical protein K9I71_03130 [Ignavibacteriales bacterium]|nr:hypothetical protein [Ignavibacteriales bacterium]MCF8435918.1 hypothetical protein [Ignavibacteriales bacterium]